MQEMLLKMQEMQEMLQEMQEMPRAAAGMSRLGVAADLGRVEQPNHKTANLSSKFVSFSESLQRGPLKGVMGAQKEL